MDARHTRISIHVFGLVTSIKYYKFKYLAERFKRKRKRVDIVCEAFLETEWEEFVDCQKRKLCGEVWTFNEAAMAFVDGKYIGGCEEFFNWYEMNIRLRAFFPEMFLHDSALEMRRLLKERLHTFVFFNINIADCNAGTLVMELYTDLLPKTCKNFIALCNRDYEDGPGGVKMHYEGTVIHRIVSGGWIQGGDLVSGAGNNGMSIYGPVFPDESFVVSHDRFGVLGMANKGPHTNGSQFYINLAPHTWMDGKMVAFGQLAFGGDVLKKVEKLETVNERPIKKTVISNCGVYSLDDIQMVDLTEDDLVLYHPIGMETPPVPVAIELPEELYLGIDETSRRK